MLLGIENISNFLINFFNSFHNLILKNITENRYDSYFLMTFFILLVIIIKLLFITNNTLKSSKLTCNNIRKTWHLIIERFSSKLFMIFIICCAHNLLLSSLQKLSLLSINLKLFFSWCNSQVSFPLTHSLTLYRWMTNQNEKNFPLDVLTLGLTFIACWA